MATATVSEPALIVSNGAPRSRRGEPTWEMTDFYPRQGEWTEAEYLALDTNRLIEFTDGVLEFLPMPGRMHLCVVKVLMFAFHDYVTKNRLGEVHVAPLPLKLVDGKYRVPDILFLNHEQIRQAGDKYPCGADLIIEVVNEGKDAHERDHEIKPVDYAQAGIKEYWIVDPETTTVKVLTVDGDVYKTHGEFKPRQSATSVLFADFSVNVDDVFAAAESETDAPKEDDDPKSS